MDSYSHTCPISSKTGLVLPCPCRLSSDSQSASSCAPAFDHTVSPRCPFHLCSVQTGQLRFQNTSHTSHTSHPKGFTYHIPQPWSPLGRPSSAVPLGTPGTSLAWEACALHGSSLTLHVVVFGVLCSPKVRLDIVQSFVSAGRLLDAWLG